MQNVCLAFTFNGLGIPAAATGLVYPIWGMVAMAASVTAIFMNSLWSRGDYFFQAIKTVGHAPQMPSSVQAEDGKEVAESVPLGEVEFLVPNMVCGGCAEKISTALTALPGIREVRPKVAQKHVYVRYEPARLPAQHLKEALDKAGFTPIET